MQKEKFEMLTRLLRHNYGSQHYADEFLADLFSEVEGVPENVVEDALRAHVRHYGDTKDRPKLQAFAKIKTDYLASIRNEKKENWFGGMDQAYSRHDSSVEAKAILAEFDKGVPQHIRKEIGIGKIESSHDLVKLCAYNAEWFNHAYKEIYRIVRASEGVA